MYIHINGDHHTDFGGQVHYDIYQYDQAKIGTKTVRRPAETEDGVWIPRESVTILYIDSNGEERDPTLWSTACCRLSLQYAANWMPNDRITYSYVLSPDPRNRLTSDDLMDIAKDCVRECFPGHDALIAVHMDTDTPHVHITISNIRGRDVEPQNWMERDKKDDQIAKSQYMAGYKHASNAPFRHHINEWAFAACQERGWVDKNSNVLIEDSRQRRYEQANLTRVNCILDAADRVDRAQDFYFYLRKNGLELTYTGKSPKLAVRDLDRPQSRAIKLETLGVSEDMILQHIYGADMCTQYTGTIQPPQNVTEHVIERTIEILALDTFVPVDAATQQQLQDTLHEAALRREACTRVYHRYCHHITGTTTDPHYTARPKGEEYSSKHYNEERERAIVAAFRDARRQHKQALRNYKVYSEADALLDEYRQFVLTLAENPNIPEEDVVRARGKYLVAIRRLATADEKVVKELRRHLRDAKHSQAIRDARRNGADAQKVVTAQQERITWQPAVTPPCQPPLPIRSEDPKRSTYTKMALWHWPLVVVAEHAIAREINLHIDQLRHYAEENDGKIPRGYFVFELTQPVVEPEKAVHAQKNPLPIPTEQSIIQESMVEGAAVEEQSMDESTETNNQSINYSLSDLLRNAEPRIPKNTAKQIRSKDDIDHVL